MRVNCWVVPTTWIWIFCIVVGLPSATAAQTTVLLTVPDSQVVDTTIRNGSYATFNHNGAVLVTRSSTDPEWERRTILAFDTTSIPANTPITSAVVTLMVKSGLGTSGATRPVAAYRLNSSFVEGQVTGGIAGHPTFPATYFGAGLVSGDYRSYAGNTADIVDLIPNAPIVTDGSRYSVLSNCVIQNDVLSTTGTFGAVMAARYANGTTGANPKIASIYAPSTYPNTADHEQTTLVEGFRIQSLGTWMTLKSPGRINYYYTISSNLFASLNCSIADNYPVGVGDMPNNPLVYYLQLRSENPVRDGRARLAFGVTRREHVELRIYDVTGRAVRTLANREFTPGEYELVWDGSDDAGRAVARGVYFYQLRTPSFVSQKKLALLAR